MNPLVLITGGTGRLGHALASEFRDALIPTHTELELTSTSSVGRFLSRAVPDIVIHTAAFTDVRVAEARREYCWDVNVNGTERIVEGLLRYSPSCYFVYISSPCVFQGDTGNYTESSIPGPCNFYGLTKLAGEYVARRMRRHLIIRTNFTARAGWPYPRAFKDRYGTYLFADDVASALRSLLPRELKGTVHIAGDRRLSMLELARLTSPEVQPITMQETDIPLTRDMTLLTERITSFKLTLGRVRLSDASTPSGR